MTEMPEKENVKLLTIQEAAVFANVGETAIRNAIYRGKLPTQMLYGRILIEQSALEDYRAKAKPGRPPKQADEKQA